MARRRQNDSRWLAARTAEVNKLTAKAEASEEVARKAMRVAVSDWMEVGKALCEVHARIGQDFRRWVDEECSLERTKAYELEKCFLRFGADEIPDEAISITSLIILMRAPLAVRQRAVKKMKDGHRVSGNDAKLMVTGEPASKEPKPEKVVRETPDEMRERLTEQANIIESQFGQIEELEDQCERQIDTIKKLKDEVAAYERMVDELTRQNTGLRAGVAA